MKIKILFVVSVILVVVLSLFTIEKFNQKQPILDFTNKDIKLLEAYSKDNDITITKQEEYSDLISKDIIIKQEIVSEQEIAVTVSLGKDFITLYNTHQVNELGLVPIMMYHGIVNMSDNDTTYTGGNVDKDGYNRTTESFRRDLEFYYQNNYRMIRLNDYVSGKINTELGKSPIILTFDDGKKNNLTVTGLDASGNIIIDPNSAVGILEEFKAKYPDFKVTATFFLNGGLFEQPTYNIKILEWLVNHGYDIGNHTYKHSSLDKITANEVSTDVAKMYDLFDRYIPNKYVKIVALPFGTPHKKDHVNFASVLNSNYNNKSYVTISTLQVGWQSNVSPFNSSFDPNFLKRIRAYDNNGLDFDIEMNFKFLAKTRYISDGDINTIVVEKDSKVLNSYNLEVKEY